MANAIPAVELTPELRKRLLLLVLENLRRSIYDFQACNGILRGDPLHSGPQIFPLAKEALYLQSILRAARAFDHHPRAASYFKLQGLRPDIIARHARETDFDLARIEAFASKLRNIRNRAIAHDDVDDLRRDRDVWQEQNMLAGELSACTQFAFAALNEMLNAEFGEQVQLLNYDGSDAEELARLARELKLHDKWAQRLF